MLSTRQNIVRANKLNKKWCTDGMKVFQPVTLLQGLCQSLFWFLLGRTTISDKSPWDTLRQIAFSLSFDTYAILLPSHHVKHPPLPPKQCCFAEKYLCGLKTTLIRGGGGGKRMIFKRISL